MSNGNGVKIAGLLLAACIAAGVLALGTAPSVPTVNESPTVQPSSVADHEWTELAFQVAKAYRPDDNAETYRLGSRKLVLDPVTRDLLLRDLDDPDLAPSDPVENKDALRQILQAAPTAEHWHQDTVAETPPSSGTAKVLSLSDPVPDLTRPGRYYFLSGQGEELYDGLGLLTVDVAEGRASILQYDIFMSLHAPTLPKPPTSASPSPGR